MLQGPIARWNGSKNGLLGRATLGQARATAPFEDEWNKLLPLQKTIYVLFACVFTLFLDIHFYSSYTFYFTVISYLFRTAKSTINL